jgi:hypothetical protein
MVRTRTTPFLLAWALAAACGRGPSAGPACPHDLSYGREVELEVVLSTFTTTIRRDLSLAELARLPGTEALGPGGKLQGLTVATQELRYNTGIAVSSRLFGGPSCAWIDHLKIDITPRKSEIIIPNEYPVDSCQYDQILAHERTHDDTTRDALSEAADDLRRALRKTDWLPSRGTPIAVADRAEAEKRIEAMVDKAAKPVYDAYLAHLKERQAIIDLPENYRWVSRRCPSWQ